MESGNLQLFKYNDDDKNDNDKDSNSKLEQKALFRGHSGGFNDFDWYPWMNSSVPGSDLFVTVSKDLPIQLWKCDRMTEPICTWTAKDHLDQVATALSATFSPDGRKIVTGGMNKLWIFDVNRPGGSAEVESSTIPKKKSNLGQRGLLSCINFRYDDTGVFLVGSFNGSIGVYDLRSVSCNSDDYARASELFQAHHPRGVSQVKFLSDGWSFLSSGRGEACLKRWDLRNLSQPSEQYSLLPEYKSTNQRIYFDSESNGNSIFTGSSNHLKLFTEDIEDLKLSDVISSVSLNPSSPDLLAVSTGTRHFYSNSDSSDDDEEEEHVDETEVKSKRISSQNQTQNELILIKR